MTKYTSRFLYAVPSICVKSEAYFLLKGMIENMRERDDITEQKVVSAQRASEIYFEKRVTGLCKPTLVQKVFFFFLLRTGA